jgi:membrane protease YdiL (CAAX protease family)
MNVKYLVHLRINGSALCILPFLLILVFLGARAFSTIFGVGVFVFSDRGTDVGYVELVTRGVAYLAVIPVSEELYFRGLVYNSLQNYYRKRSAVILTSFYFAVGHVSNPPSLMLWFFLKGLVYVGFYEKYKTLAPGIALHALTNLPIAV